MLQTGLVAAPAGPATRASARPVAPTAATAAMPALARVVRGRHPRTRWRPAGALAPPEPGPAVSDDDFAEVCMTGSWGFITGSFSFRHQCQEIAVCALGNCS